MTAKCKTQSLSILFKGSRSSVLADRTRSRPRLPVRRLRAIGHQQCRHRAGRVQMDRRRRL